MRPARHRGPAGGVAASRGPRRLLVRLPPPARAALARGLWRIRARLGQPALPVPRGGSGRDDRPGVVVVALGLDADEVGHLADSLAGAQRRTGARLLLVVDTDAFAHLRAHELPFEYVPPRADWETHLTGREPALAGMSYERFVANRLEAILAAYRPHRVVAASPDGELSPATLDALTP